jgi:hypothetical protein
MLDLAQRFDLKGLTLTAQRGEEGQFFFYASASAHDADGNFLHGSGYSHDATSLSECIKEALGDLIIKRAPVVELVELPAIEVKPELNQWDYKGWSISYDLTPIPDRSFDWTATSPDYDVDCDQDGFHRAGGEQVHAATYEGLLEEIDRAIAEAEDERAAA